jgi:hypothetical protein
MDYLTTLLMAKIIAMIFFGEGPRSRSYGLTTVLRLNVQPCGEDEEKDY